MAHSGKQAAERAGRYRLAAGALAGWLWWVAPAAAAAPVAVLVERGPSIYQLALRGFQQSFPKDQFEVIPVEQDAPAALAKLRKNQYRLVVAIGTQAARAAQEHLPGVALLYCLALNPQQQRLSGPDIGGISFEVPLAQQIAQIRKALPGAQRIGVIYNEAVSGATVREAERLLSPGIRLVKVQASTPQEAARQIPDLLGRVDAFWMIWDRVVLNPANFRLLRELSLKNKVALIAPAAPFVEEGALLSVGANYERAGRRAAEMAQQILESGRRAGQFIEAPQEAVLTVNGQVARRVGVTIPPELPAEILSP